MLDLTLALSIFFVIIAIMIGLRFKIGERFEIRNSDILIALIPVALWLVFTGKVQKLEFGEFKIEAAFIEASRASVEKQITPIRLPVETLTMSPKGGIERIPELIHNKTEALVFRLGYGGYYWPAIEEYLKRLSDYPFFKYIIIQEKNGSFFGLADARDLISIFKLRSRGFTSRDFEKWLRTSDRESFYRIPGFISRRNAITQDTDKKTALELMEKLDINILPVIDNNGKFAGVVNRARLTASLIIDVANKVK